MSTICNVVASYLETLSATQAICDALGDTLTFGTNLFIGGSEATETNIITIIPYGGSPPEIDNKRQNPSIQIESKTSSRHTGLNLQQALINTLHMNELNGNGKMRANQSMPIPLGVELGGRRMIYVSNYNIKHVKI